MGLGLAGLWGFEFWGFDLRGRHEPMRPHTYLDSLLIDLVVLRLQAAAYRAGSRCFRQHAPAGHTNPKENCRSTFPSLSCLEGQPRKISALLPFV